MVFNSEQLKTILSSPDIRTLLVEKLRECWRWDDFQLLDDIVSSLSNTCQELITSYKQRICGEMKLQHIYEQCKKDGQEIPEGYDKMIAIIKNKKFFEITLTEYEELKKFVSKHCGVRSSVICPFCRAGSHSSMLEWYIPLTAVKHMVDIALTNIDVFIAKGFVYLKISQTRILDERNTVS